MPSHIKMALTRTAEVIPFVDGRLCLGTWQGVFLWEHRARSQPRRVVSYRGVRAPGSWSGCESAAVDDSVSWLD